MKESQIINEIEISDNWQQLLYVEGWKLYIHEDQLAQTRTNFFLGIQAGLITILAAISSVLVKSEPTIIAGRKVYLGLIILGGLSMLIGVFSLLISKNLEYVTNAGRQYLNLRWTSVAAIERLVNLKGFGLAQLEHGWRNATGDFAPFTDLRLSDFKLHSMEKVRGYDSMLNVISIWKRVCICIIIIGILLIFIGLLPAAQLKSLAHIL